MLKSCSKQSIWVALSQALELQIADAWSYRAEL